MTIRSRRETVTFRHPFRRRHRTAAAHGAYEIATDEEAIEGLTFAACRRIATMIMVPADGVRGSLEMFSIGSVDLANAQAADERSSGLQMRPPETFTTPSTVLGRGLSTVLRTVIRRAKLGAILSGKGVNPSYHGVVRG
jgi:hypothetical protein